MIPHTRSAHLRLLERKLLHWLNECSGHFWLHRSRSHVVFLAAFLPLEHKGNGCIRAIFTRQEEYRSLQKHRYSKNQRHSRVKDLDGKQNLIVWSGCKIWIDIYIYNDNNMGWYILRYGILQSKECSSVREPGGRKQSETPRPGLQSLQSKVTAVADGYGNVGDVDVGWSRLISVDVVWCW